MKKICEITKKTFLKGYKVSFSKKKKKYKFFLNLKKRKILLNNKLKININLSKKGLKKIEKIHNKILYNEKKNINKINFNFRK